MKAKLIKSDIQYRLHNEEGIVIATSTDGKLSIKNCEAITNGYDLDELLDCLLINRGEHFSRVRNPLYGEERQLAKDLVQKALEILGDKKFSELDMRIAYDAGCNNIDADDNIDFQDTINSLQQTEFDVEIVTEPYVKSVSRTGNTVYPPLGIQNKLDSDGCLILKRI